MIKHSTRRADATILALIDLGETPKQIALDLKLNSVRTVYKAMERRNKYGKTYDKKRREK